MAKKSKSTAVKTSEPALFSTEQYSSGITQEIGDIERSLTKDPYWDEIVLDSEITQTESNGQTTLFYDSSNEPPEPSQFDSLKEYNQAYKEWETNYPDLANHGFSEELDKLIPANVKANTFIVEKTDNALHLGIITSTNDKGFYVDWLNFGESAKEIINFFCGANFFSSWERDQFLIERFAIAPQSLVDKFLIANPNFFLANKNNPKITGKDKGFKIGQKLFSNHPYGNFIVEVAEYPVISNGGDWIDYKTALINSNQLIACIFLSTKPQPPKPENYTTDFLYQKAIDKYQANISKQIKPKVGKIYLHSSGKKVKVKKVLKFKAAGFAEVYFVGNPISQRVAIADLSFLPVPQCKDFTSFEDFDKAYQEWLNNCDDEDFDDSQQLSSNEIWEQFLAENQGEICSNTLHFSQVSEALNSELNKQGQEKISAPESLLKITQKPNECLVTDSPKSNSTQISKTGNQNQVNTTSIQSDFPVQEQASLATVQDLTTQNHHSGLKPSGVLPMAAPVSSSSKILQGLSITDFEQFLGDSEWLAISGMIRKSYQLRNLAHPMKENGFSLLPTPTTYPKGSGKYRPAGTNRLEQKLRPFINKGDKLHPAVPGWMMGFPVGWVEQVLADTGELLSVQPPLIPVQATTSTTAATVLTSTVEQLHPNKPASQSNESVTLPNLPELLTPTNNDKQTTTHNKPWYEGKFNLGDHVIWKKYPDLIYEIAKPEKGGHVVVELKSDSDSAPLRKRVAVIYLTPTTETARFSIGDRIKLFDDDVVEIRSLKSDGIVTTGNFFVPFDHILESLTKGRRQEAVKPTFKTGEYVLNGRVGQIIEDSPKEYFTVKYSLTDPNDLKCYFWGQDDELIDQIVIAPPDLVKQFVRENKEASEQEVKSKRSKIASGSLAPFLENKKLKSGEIITYPRVNGERDKLNYDHWRWGYYYEVKVNGEWRNKSLPVPARIAPLVREMIDKNYPVEEIKSFILQCKNKKGGDKID